MNYSPWWIEDTAAFNKVMDAFALPLKDSATKKSAFRGNRGGN